MDEGDFQVTLPRPEDGDQLASVHVSGWREAYGEVLPERFYDASALEGRRQMWSRILAADDCDDRVRVARHDDQVIGFALRGPTHGGPDYAPKRDDQLYALYVLSAWYGRNVGQALLDECLQGRGAELWVAQGNTRASRFYEKNGFVRDGDTKIDPELDGLAEVRMVR